ncbi:MAG TPA: TIGR03118 family protein [Acidothermaceae bacterium]|nr:TIGR03118 family protein [Acidothermaceae bacterium]
MRTTRHRTTWNRAWSRALTGTIGTGVVAATLAIAPAGMASANDDQDADLAVTQTNLVSDQMGHAPLVDPNLVNAWGMSFGTGATPTPLWVSDNGADVATLYRGATSPASFTKVPLTVSIPNGAPTGQVFNPSSTEFMVKSGPARFIFASESGWITGFNPAAGTAMAEPAVHLRHAIYKGLALASSNGADFLYGADFHSNKIRVFNTSFKLQHWAGAFEDKQLPKGYAPFNIQLLNGMLYVTYAKQDAAKVDDAKGPGRGFVDVYTTSGVLKQRLVKKGHLNSPWGLAIAPSSWGNLAGMLLVGNFGDGHINAYNPMTGRFLGQLRDADGRAIDIDGLWALLPGNGVAATPDQVIFSAGPDDEAHGLVGVLDAKPMPDGDDG